MSRIYTRRFFNDWSLLAPKSWTVPSDGNVYIIRDVWWSAVGIDVETAALQLAFAGTPVWGANVAGNNAGPGFAYWYWQGRQQVLAGEEVQLVPVGSPVTSVGWIGTGYVLSP